MEGKKQEYGGWKGKRGGYKEKYPTKNPQVKSLWWWQGNQIISLSLQQWKELWNSRKVVRYKGGGSGIAVFRHNGGASQAQMIIFGHHCVQNAKDLTASWTCMGNHEGATLMDVQNIVTWLMIPRGRYVTSEFPIFLPKRWWGNRLDCPKKYRHLSGLKHYTTRGG